MFRSFCLINIQVVGNSSLKIYCVWHGGFVIVFLPYSFSPKVSLLHCKVSENIYQSSGQIFKADIKAH